MAKRKMGAAKRFLIQFVAGMAFGAGVGVLAGELGLFDAAKAADWTLDEILSLMLAAMMLALAGFSAYATSSTERYARLMKNRPEPDEPVDPTDIKGGGAQALVLALAGIMLPIPVLLAHMDASLGLRWAAAGGIAVLTAIESWYNWRIWRESDELMRNVIAAAGAVSFWVLQFVLFGWAVLAKLALVPDLGSWGAMTLTLFIYFLASAAVGLRRGLATA